MKKISLLLGGLALGLCGCVIVQPNTSRPLYDDSFTYFLRVDQGVDLSRNTVGEVDGAFQYAMQTGKTVYWRRGDEYGVIVAKQKFITSTGRACRYFASRTKVNGTFYIARGEACRSARGVWLVQ